MNDTLQRQFLGLGEKVIEYLPNLFAGIVLVVVGWFLGWLAKRVIVQIAVILRLERFLTSFRWGKEFSRADVRYGFYGFIGNIAFLIVFLIFLGNAFSAWKLVVLSTVLQDAVYFFPRTFASLAIFGIGWLIASWAAKSVQRALRREDIPRATLVGRFVKAVLLVLFSAMALVELNVARQIVIIGFATIFITLGILTIVLIWSGGKEFVQKILQTFDEEK
jgi:hypothetical protein